MQETNEKVRVIFNAVILVSSILAIIFVTIVWEVRDSSVILSYILSTSVSLLAFHQLKVRLLKGHSLDIEESVEMRFPMDVKNRQTFSLYIFIALILVTPLIILFLVPRLWLIILDGMVSGATVSELIIYLQRKEITKAS